MLVTLRGLRVKRGEKSKYKLLFIQLKVLGILRYK